MGEHRPKRSLNESETRCPRTEDAAQQDGETSGDKRRPRRRPVPLLLKTGARLQAVAALLWLPQAALLAYGVGYLANTGFDATIYYLAAGLFLLAVYAAF